jgi:SET domain-containing protein
MRRVVVRGSPAHGKGVFALQPIGAGSRILEYKGEVGCWERAIARHQRGAREGHTFLFGLSDGRVIDGSRGGNSVRWLNHACTPNCAAVEIDGRVFIDAVSDIKPGDELFIDYRLDIEGRRSAALRMLYACHCESPRCRGTMLSPRRQARH